MTLPRLLAKNETLFTIFSGIGSHKEGFDI